VTPLRSRLAELYRRTETCPSWSSSCAPRRSRGDAAPLELAPSCARARGARQPARKRRALQPAFERSPVRRRGRLLSSLLAEQDRIEELCDVLGAGSRASATRAAAREPHRQAGLLLEGLHCAAERGGAARIADPTRDGRLEHLFARARRRRAPGLKPGSRCARRTSPARSSPICAWPAALLEQDRRPTEAIAACSVSCGRPPRSAEVVRAGLPPARARLERSAARVRRRADRGHA
jgi:hypothetical protein